VRIDREVGDDQRSDSRQPASSGMTQIARVRTGGAGGRRAENGFARRGLSEREDRESAQRPMARNAIVNSRIIIS